MTHRLTPIQEVLLSEHIPYRIDAIDLMGFACMCVRSGSTGMPLRVHFGDHLVIEAPSAAPVTNPLIEVGAVFARGLLNFLGISRSSKVDSLIEVNSTGKRFADDYFIEQFHLPRVTLDGIRTLHASQVMDPEAALLAVLRVADKAVAHITKYPLDPDLLRELEAASRIVISAVNAYLYEPLGRSIASRVYQRKTETPRPLASAAGVTTTSSVVGISGSFPPTDRRW